MNALAQVQPKLESAEAIAEQQLRTAQTL